MEKTPLQIFEERVQRKSCVTCAKLIVKPTPCGHINFCGHCGKIILDRFLDCGNLSDCDYEEREVAE